MNLLIIIATLFAKLAVADQAAFDVAAEKPDGKTVVIAAAIGYNLVTFTPVSYTHLTLPTIYSV